MSENRIKRRKIEKVNNEIDKNTDRFSAGGILLTKEDIARLKEEAKKNRND